MSYKSKGIEEDSRSSEGIGELEEEGFYSFREEVNCSGHQTWSPFEDLDDSGHFTGSPDGETALSGSSRSHSPCFLSSPLQMQHPTTLPFDKPQQVHVKGHPLQQTDKPLISPHSVMTVTVPKSAIDVTDSDCNSLYTRHLSSPLRPQTFCYGSNEPRESYSTMPKSNTAGEEFGAFEDAAGEASGEGTTYLQGILENFNSLMKEKIRMLDDLVTEGNEEQKVFLVNNMHFMKHTTQVLVKKWF